MSPSPNDQPFKSLRRHDDYHLTGGDIYFLVEQVQFRVHRYFFERESLYFQAKLATPASPGSTKQGGSESTAIVLEDVKAENFARFLWVFYNSKYSLYDTCVEDWTAILDLAHRWTFPEVKNLCIRELEKLEMDDISRIVAYHKYDVDRRLLVPRYAALCQREQALTLEEGLSLGMETTLNIFRARECARTKPSFDGLRSPAPIDMDEHEMKGLVTDLFGISELPPAPAPAPQVNGTTATHTANRSASGTGGTVTPVVKPAETKSAPKDLKVDTTKATGSGAITKNNDDASKTGGDTSKPNGDANKANGDANKASGDANKANGDANGEADKAAGANGDAANANGDKDKPLIDTGSATAADTNSTTDDRPSTPGARKGGKGNKKAWGF